MMNEDRRAKAAADLENALLDTLRYEAGEVPSARELADAPVLSQWFVQTARDGVLLLAGDCIGHPRLGSQWITTSPLIYIAKDRTWARTRSRLYRLESMHPLMQYSDNSHKA